jgi:glutathione S-transferase
LNDAAIEVTAFAWVPSFARGYVRDLRVRWALEEIGLPYRVRLIGGAGGSPLGPARPENFLLEQPFGQVPAYREGDLCLFESGAIVLHIGEKDERLLPRDPAGRARAIAWVFAALNSIELQTVTLAVLGFAFPDADWTEAARRAFIPRVEMRLAAVAAALGDKEWLEGVFTIGDLMMIDALRAVPEEGRLSAHENLAAYVARGTARPAFQRALAAQLGDFIEDAVTA